MTKTNKQLVVAAAVFGLGYLVLKASQASAATVPGAGVAPSSSAPTTTPPRTSTPPKRAPAPRRSPAVGTSTSDLPPGYGTLAGDYVLGGPGSIFENIADLGLR